MKILIAEDQHGLALLLQAQVRAWGYDPVLVADGVAAVDALSSSGAARLALMDWHMPGLSGIDVVRRIRATPEGAYAYLILMTGIGGRDKLLEGLAAGADEFLQKPVEAAELQVRLAAGRRIVELQQELRHLATRDALTGLWNRGAILTRLEQELARGAREGHPVGMVLVDLDHFKRINDTHGHQGGDRALRLASECICASLRSYDAVGRYGGEEFLIVLPGCDEVATVGLAERLRQAVAAEPVAHGEQHFRLTLSAGTAVWHGGAIEVNALLQCADANLYRAKHNGRNQVVASEPSA